MLNNVFCLFKRDVVDIMVLYKACFRFFSMGKLEELFERMSVVFFLKFNFLFHALIAEMFIMKFNHFLFCVNI